LGSSRVGEGGRAAERFPTLQVGDKTLVFAADAGDGIVTEREP
jgi:hypothetical protein